MHCYHKQRGSKESLLEMHAVCAERLDSFDDKLLIILFI